MVGMPRVQSIRRLRRNGESVASIARKTHVSEPTVRKYLAKEDLSAVPSVRKPRASVIDPYLPVIEQWLAEDRANWRKQRHTATRIWERLRDEHGATAIEYGLIAALIAIACIMAFQMLGPVSRSSSTTCV